MRRRAALAARLARTTITGARCRATRLNTRCVGSLACTVWLVRAPGLMAVHGRVQYRRGAQPCEWTAGVQHTRRPARAASVAREMTCHRISAQPWIALAGRGWSCAPRSSLVLSLRGCCGIAAIMLQYQRPVLTTMPRASNRALHACGWRRMAAHGAVDSHGISAATVLH